jgi:hypothetical protein
MVISWYRNLDFESSTLTYLGSCAEFVFPRCEEKTRINDQNANPQIFDNWAPGPGGCGGSSLYPLLAYNAILALGVAVSQQLPQNAFTGPKFYQQLFKTLVEGISGSVSFDNVTRTSPAKHILYRLSKIVFEFSQVIVQLNNTL